MVSRVSEYSPFLLNSTFILSKSKNDLETREKYAYLLFSPPFFRHLHIMSSLLKSVPLKNYEKIVPFWWSNFVRKYSTSFKDRLLEKHFCPADHEGMEPIYILLNRRSWICSTELSVDLQPRIVPIQ